MWRNTVLMKIAVIFNDPIGYGATMHYFMKIMRDKGIHFQHFWCSDAHNIPRDFDLYFRFDHGDYKDDVPEDMHPTVWHVVDTHLKKPYKKIRRQAQHYDIMFCAQHTAVARLRKDAKVDAQWVPLGSDLQHKKHDLPKKYDIGFVGRSANKFDRGRHLPLLKEKYPNSHIGQANFEDISKVYSASKIGFNSSIQNDINMRMFEIPASGCFLLTNRIDNGGLYEIFEEGKHFVTYTNDNDLVEKIEYYLKNDDEREAIAKAGHERIINNFTYIHMLQKMFNYMAFKFGGKFNEFRI